MSGESPYVVIRRLTLKNSPPAVEKRFVGNWRIVSASEWDTEYLDLVGPAKLKISASGSGTINFGAFGASVDAMTDELRPEDSMQFSFYGEDEGDEVCGRGYAIEADNVLKGRICFHRGMTSNFIATRITKPAVAPKKSKPRTKKS